MRHTYIRLLVASTALVSISAQAQTVPNTARPEVIKRQLEDRDTRPEVGGAPVISSEPKASKPIKGDMKFTLRDIKFEGLGAFTEEDLKPIYEGKLGQTISLSDLNGIVDQITAFYRNQGYILSRAVLPPQRIEGGHVTIRIVEGYVNKVTLNGDVGSDSSPIHTYAQKIKDSRPLNAATLERYLLLMQDLPGVTARAVLSPSPNTPEASDVVVTVTRKPVDFAASLDNRGSRFLGPIQGGVTLAGNNLINMDEQTQLRAISTVFEPDELKFVEVRHEQQLWGDGLKFVFAANYVTTEPGSTIESLDIEGDSSGISAGLSYPIIRSRQTNWFVNGDFAMKHTDVNTLNTSLYEDKLRVFTLGTSYDFLDGWSAVNRMDMAVAQGISWDTGKNNGLARSRTNGDTNFTKISGKITRLQPISGPWSAFAAVSGQYSKDPLLAGEEFVVGGQEFGSAYDSAEITGDSGVATRAELQYNENAGFDYLSQYQLYGFYDIGKVWNRNVIANSEAKHISIASTGLGARFNLTPAWSGGLEGAVPLTKKVSAFGQDGSSPRAFFSLQYRY